MVSTGVSSIGGVGDSNNNNKRRARTNRVRMSWIPPLSSDERHLARAGMKCRRQPFCSRAHIFSFDLCTECRSKNKCE